MKVVLITVDNHTIAIQSVARILQEKAGIDSTLFYLPSHLRKYPLEVEERILQALTEEIEGEANVLIGFHLKELSFSRSLQLASAIRKKFGNGVKLVAGGSYATSMQDQLLENFDYVVIGSGEGILPIVEAIKIGKETRTPLIKSPFNFYAYPLFTEARVLDESGKGEIVRSRIRPFVHPQYKKKQSLEIMLEVGCSYSCSYCEVATLREILGNSYRINLSDPQEAVRVIQKELSSSPHIEYIYFFDEDFLLKPQTWVDTFAELYSKDVGLPFFIFATPFSVLRSKAKLLKLTDVGLDTVNVGIQTGSEKIAKNLFKRKESKEDVFRAIETLSTIYHQGRISSIPMIDFIILNPYETVEDMKDTIGLIGELPLPFEAVMHCMSFFRGTPLYRQEVNDRKIPEGYAFHSMIYMTS